MTSDRNGGTTLYAFEGCAPALHPSAWIAPTACLIGRVEIAARVTVMFNVVLRADHNAIRVGMESNIQDGVVVHCDPPDIPTGRPVIIGRRVSVGHGARLHGCSIGDGSLIGVGAVVLDGAVVGAGSLVAANALVPPGMPIPPDSLVVGSPASVKRPVRPKDREMLELAADAYLDLARRYRASLSPRPEPPAASLTALDWRLLELYHRLVGGDPDVCPDAIGAALGAAASTLAPMPELEASLSRLQAAGMIAAGTDVPLDPSGPYLPPLPLTRSGANLLASATPELAVADQPPDARLPSPPGACHVGGTIDPSYARD